MKANYHKLNKPVDQAFHIRKDVRDYFFDKWHFHDMVELVYIQQGQGLMYIGDCIEPFSDGQVVLVGCNLPHVWKSDFSDQLLPKEEKCISYVIQFPIDFLGDHFSKLTESKQIFKLLKRAERGIAFDKEVKKVLAKKISALLNLSGMEKLIYFLDLLQCASVSTDYRLLASPMFVDSNFSIDQKINSVFAYVMDNFTESIQLETAASIACMNKTAFCRYFKRRTKKTFTTFLNEVRIGYACKLIQDGTPITGAAYRSGYNSPSYFYTQFKLIKGCSPSEYQSAIDLYLSDIE